MKILQKTLSGNTFNDFVSTSSLYITQVFCEKFRKKLLLLLLLLLFDIFVLFEKIFPGNI